MQILKVFAIFILISIAFAACERNPNDIIATHRRHIDTLSKHHIRLLDKELDSLCQLDYKVKLKLTVDSIMQIRQAEIREIRGN